MGRSDVTRGARVIGAGIAGASAAMSLARLGWQVAMTGSPRRAGHVIALNSAARFILDRMWGAELLANVPQQRLARRVILWRDRTPQQIDDETVVVDAPALAGRMAAHAAAAKVAMSEGSCEPASWTVVATGRSAPGEGTLTGGDRVAIAARVALAAAADADALLIEATPRGWTALLPAGGREGVVFACVPKPGVAPHDALQESIADTHAARHSIAAVIGPCASFDAAPRFRLPPQNSVAIVHVGDAALAFDPLSGDGAGVALRTAHLAASLAEAYARGTDLDALLEFHAYRLARAMSAHLRGLLRLYAQAPLGTSWSGELAAMRAMADAVDGSLQDMAAPAFAISQDGLAPYAGMR